MAPLVKFDFLGCLKGLVALQNTDQLDQEGRDGENGFASTGNKICSLVYSKFPNTGPFLVQKFGPTILNFLP